MKKEISQTKQKHPFVPHPQREGCAICSREVEDHERAWEREEARDQKSEVNQ